MMTGGCRKPSVQRSPANALVELSGDVEETGTRDRGQGLQLYCGELKARLPARQARLGEETLAEGRVGEQLTQRSLYALLAHGNTFRTRPAFTLTEPARA